MHICNNVKQKEQRTLTSSSKPFGIRIWPFTLSANALDCSKIIFLRSCQKYRPNFRYICNYMHVCLNFNINKLSICTSTETLIPTFFIETE